MHTSDTKRSLKSHSSVEKWDRCEITYHLGGQKETWCWKREVISVTMGSTQAWGEPVYESEIEEFVYEGEE